MLRKRVRQDAFSDEDEDHRGRREWDNASSKAHSAKVYIPFDVHPETLRSNLELLDIDTHSNSGSKIEHIQTETTQICYGALVGCKARVTFIEKLSATTFPWQKYYTFEVVDYQGSYVIIQKDQDPSLNFDISFQLVMSSSIFQKLPRKPTKKKTIIDVTINIIGPEGIVDSVGDAIGEAEGYLHHPEFLAHGLKYINPHYFYIDNNVVDLRNLIGRTKINNDSSKRITDTVNQVLASLDHSNFLPTSKSDIAFTANGFLKDVVLKSYQIDGIKFILSREDSGVCYKVDRELLRSIHPSLKQQSSVPCAGGIVADIMGLGKTLTMLSAIACSKIIIGEGVSCNAADGASPQWLNATLIVLPSIQIMDVWEFEIAKYFQPQVLKVARFHGQNRPVTQDAFAEIDVILTTYHTLAADFKALRVLQDVIWNRVVLDEAHWIRNQYTWLFKAAESLKAEKKWCLTGTPIQNSLHDLRSLLKFLNYSPLCQSSSFEKYIIDPLRENSENSARNLQLLLRVICIRRAESYLNLPPLITEVVPVNLSPDESKKYEEILSDCKAEFEEQVCKGQSKAKYSILFAATMKLRRLCSHGILSASRISRITPPSSNNYSDNSKMDLDVADDESCQSCQSAEEISANVLNGMNFCPSCGRLLPLTEKYQSELGSNVRQAGTLDNQYLRALSSQTSSYPSSRAISTYSVERASSSKLEAVASNIQNLHFSAESTPGSKSIVFSSWRATLDNLEEILAARGIPSLKIDGRVCSLDRSATISQFKTDASIIVLLMTIDSCAVGLTLTNANRVHLIEPHWNPAMEAQAIARAHRMGQTQAVTVYKYITQRTVEKNIVALQERKSRLATFTLADNEENDANGVLDDLKFVLSAE